MEIWVTKGCLQDVQKGRDICKGNSLFSNMQLYLGQRIAFQTPVKICQSMLVRWELFCIASEFNINHVLEFFKVFAFSCELGGV